MKKKVIIHTVSVFLLMSLACLGAGEALSEKMLGRWQDVEGQYGVLEFTDEGSFVMQILAFKKPTNKIDGKWIVLEDGRVQMDYIVITTNTVVVDITFDADQMHISNDDSSVTRYVRAADSKPSSSEKSEGESSVAAPQVSK